MPAPVSAVLHCPNHPEVRVGLEACGGCGRHFCSDCLVALAGVTTCAGCKPERLRDLRTGALELDLAGPGRRFVAAMLDGLLFLIPGLALSYAGLQHAFEFGPHFGPSPPPGTLARFGFHAERGFWLPVLCTGLLAVAFIVYEAWMLSARGQTLGKMALGLKVVTPQGGALRARQAWVRALSRELMSRLYYPLGMLDDLLIFSGRHRTLHDRLAGTVVVNVRR